MHSSEEFRSKQQSCTRSVCVCLRLILDQVENITGGQSDRNDFKFRLLAHERLSFGV